MADYREHYAEIRAAGADLLAISVDPPAQSEALRRNLRLPFAILCDTERSVVKAWDIYNPSEKGGIAKPAVFVIDRDRKLLYAAVDTVAARVPATQIVQLLQTNPQRPHLRPRVQLPPVTAWLHALRNLLRR